MSKIRKLISKIDPMSPANRAKRAIGRANRVTKAEGRKIGEERRKRGLNW
ncbi:MAG: hypothetical protein AB1467_01115 [Candidatus Diapherotrites archaeon]